MFALFVSNNRVSMLSGLFLLMNYFVFYLIKKRIFFGSLLLALVLFAFTYVLSPAKFYDQGSYSSKLKILRNKYYINLFFSDINRITLLGRGNSSTYYNIETHRYGYISEFGHLENIKRYVFLFIIIISIFIWFKLLMFKLLKEKTIIDYNIFSISSFVVIVITNVFLLDSVRINALLFFLRI